MTAPELTEGDLMELVSLKWKAEWEGSLRYTLENWSWRFIDPELAKAAQARDDEAFDQAFRSYRNAIAAWENSHRADGAELINAHQWRTRLVTESLRALNWEQAAALTGILHGDIPDSEPGADPFLDWLRTGGLVDRPRERWELTVLGEQIAREADALTMWVFRKKSCGCCLVHMASSDPYLGELASEDEAWAALERIYPGRGASLELEGLPFAEFAARLVGQGRCEHR